MGLWISLFDGRQDVPGSFGKARVAQRPTLQQAQGRLLRKPRRVGHPRGARLGKLGRPARALNTTILSDVTVACCAADFRRAKSNPHPCRVEGPGTWGGSECGKDGAPAVGLFGKRALSRRGFLFRSSGACSLFHPVTHGLRRGLYSVAASRLRGFERGGLTGTTGSRALPGFLTL